MRDGDWVNRSPFGKSSFIDTNISEFMLKNGDVSEALYRPRGGGKMEMAWKPIGEGLDGHSMAKIYPTPWAASPYAVRETIVRTKDGSETLLRDYLWERDYTSSASWWHERRGLEPPKREEPRESHIEWFHELCIRHLMGILGVDRYCAGCFVVDFDGGMPCYAFVRLMLLPTELVARNLMLNRQYTYDEIREKYADYHRWEIAELEEWDEKRKEAGDAENSRQGEGRVPA